MTTPEGSVAFASTLIRMNEAGKLSVTDSGFYTSVVVDDTLSVTRSASGTEVTLELTTQMFYGIYGLAAGATAFRDLSNTAHVRLILPEDVTIASSSSGTFGVPIVPIPEPGSMMLSGAGLLLLAAVARKKMRRRAGGGYRGARLRESRGRADARVAPRAIPVPTNDLAVTSRAAARW